ncbi:DUF1538 domain-containing protein [Breznakiella homolactica]|uniref:DUF1538 domain-containing protein n=1 Tax=Breznakiella homolactica TaxID=2798577 RepID=A0A7T7XKL7_9SPIR|nr:DUF1538 domain-containing protein [Breznakiella homolactica]QQO07927.1 DUF1538 domain-containing protein [Breznakiella homolactica]
MEKIKSTLLEVLYGVIPIVILISILQFTIARLPWDYYFDFLAGTVFLVVGLTMFLIGLEIGFIPFGESFGSSLVKSGKMRIILLFGFIIGVVVTLPEPDVQVLAAQADAYLDTVSKPALILGIALGVGLFVALALFRIFKGIEVKYILTAGYGIVFILLIFCPPEFASLAFDAGGVTTGSLTVPFIMSMGVGVASVTSKGSSSANNFGILAIASLGPVITLLAMGVLNR